MVRFFQTYQIWSSTLSRKGGMLKLLNKAQDHEKHEANFAKNDEGNI
jgi:hypothetical protein